MTNTAHVKGRQPAPGAPIPGIPKPTDQDTAAVTLVDPRINLEKTVYAGQNSGASCPGSELVIAAPNSPITYCFVVTNPGDTYLNNIVIGDTDLGIISPTAPILLPPRAAAFPWRRLPSIPMPG